MSWRVGLCQYRRYKAPRRALIYWKGGNNRVPSAGFLSTASFKEEVKGSSSSSKAVFQQGKFAVAGTAVAWNGISLDGTYANSFNTKYKIYQMVREYNYVIHSTQGEGGKCSSPIFIINKLDGIVWYTMTFDLDNYKYIL